MVRIYLFFMVLLLMCSCNRSQSGLEAPDNAGQGSAGRTGFLLCRPSNRLHGGPDAPIRFSSHHDVDAPSAEEMMEARSYRSLMRWSEYSSFYSDMPESE